MFTYMSPFASFEKDAGLFKTHDARFSQDPQAMCICEFLSYKTINSFCF